MYRNPTNERDTDGKKYPKAFNRLWAMKKYYGGKKYEAYRWWKSGLRRGRATQ